MARRLALATAVAALVIIGVLGTGSTASAYCIAPAEDVGVECVNPCLLAAKAWQATVGDAIPYTFYCPL